MQNLKKLREITGAGLQDCQKALVEANNDIDKAMDLLRLKGLSKAAKKVDRVASEGVIATYILDDKAFAMLELNCETDFVARNSEFNQAAEAIAKVAAQYQTKDLLSQKIGKDSVEEYMKGLIAKFGENIVLGKVVFGKTSGFYQSYVHYNLKIGVVLEVIGESSEAKDRAREVAMHAAAMAPMFLDEGSVSSSALGRERAIYLEELKSVNKPDVVKAKIVDGKIDKFYESACLVRQKLISNSEVTVKEYMKGLQLVSMYRFVLGEVVEDHNKA